MDLGSINSKLRANKYERIYDVLYDIGLVWDNCKLYNREDSQIFKTADKMEKLFQKKVRQRLCFTHRSELRFAPITTLSK
jgi:histone acetyltransferase